MRASFETSVCVLPGDALRGFRLLGLLGPRTVPGWVLGPLLGRRNADDVLDTLVDGNLLRQTGIDCAGSPRYRLHDLLRAFALEGARTIPEAERREAVRRLLDAWVDLAGHAADRLPPSLFRVPSRASGLDESTMDCLSPGSGAVVRGRARHAARRGGAGRGLAAGRGGVAADRHHGALLRPSQPL